MLKRPKGSVERQVEAVRRSLRSMDAALAGLSQLLRNLPANGGHTGSGGLTRKANLSPSRLKALKLHGRYLGYIRQLKRRQRDEVKAVREKKGVEAAIKLARELAR